MTDERTVSGSAVTGEPVEVATLGGGCFWCLEAVFQEVRGVHRVVSGYAGGRTDDPTYEQVCSGTTGHAEVVQIHFDPEQVAYSDLLRIFFGVHDPTTRDRQGADVGSQYRSVILWSDDGQRAAATEIIGEVESSGAYGAPIVTEVAPLTTFYEAEPHHQDYHRRNPRQPYCQVVIDPKLAKFRQLFGRLRKGAVSIIVLVAAWAMLSLSPSGAVSQELISTQAMLARPPVAADHRVAYGPEPEHFGDLYLPSGDGPFPVVVLVHGGCWRSIAGLDYTSHLAREITSNGWAVWNIEFRRIDQPGGAWPGILNDVADAASYLDRLAEKQPLDLGRVVTAGHSSGGHLALWLASSDVTPLRVRGVIALAAIADLRDFHGRSDRGCGAGIVTALLGGEPDRFPDRLRRASPAETLPLRVAQLLITGDEDRTVPLAHTEVYAERARKAGDSVQVIAAPQAGHFEIVAPWSAAFTPVRTAVRAFLAGFGADG